MSRGTPQHRESIRIAGDIPVELGQFVGNLMEISEDALYLDMPQGLPEVPIAAAPLKIHLSESEKWTLKGSFAPSWREGLRRFEPAPGEAMGELLGRIRKDQHIDICQFEDVEASDRLTGFERLSFQPYALSGLNECDVDTSRAFLGRRFDYPILVTGMTGGLAKGREINLRLAKAASALNIPMGIGSQRLALDNAAWEPVFRVKDAVPDLFLMGNLGFSQTIDSGAVDRCRRAVDMIGADALAIHLNVIQECVQVEGDRRFAGWLAKLEAICSNLDVPVLVKEVGSGLSPQAARELRDAGASAIDVGGRGGTSWGHIEGLRSTRSQTQELGRLFRNWGIPTAFSLAAIKKEIDRVEIVATGGVRDGITVAKACALGACMVGIGLPLLKAAIIGEEAVVERLDTYTRALKIVMLATGSRTLDELSRSICLGEPLESQFMDCWHQTKDNCR